jgi:predicted DNA binding CopG/RHH family protein
MKQPKISDLRIDRKGTSTLRELVAKSKKVKITINIDEALIFEIRRMAEKNGSPYQTFLNKMLKDALSAKSDEESRLDRIERELKILKKKLAA